MIVDQYDNFGTNADANCEGEMSVNKNVISQDLHMDVIPENDCAPVVSEDENDRATGMPSSGRKQTLFEEDSETSTLAEDVKNVSPAKNECVWGLRGWCKIHKLYGKKLVTTTKVWKKKKDGTFGNAYRKKTSYTCSGLGERGNNLVTPSLVTLNESENCGARLLGVGRTSSGETLTLRVGKDYGAM